MMTHEEIITVVVAHKQGKEIQWRANREATWLPVKSPLWRFDGTNEYRVKPEPREWWIDIMRHGFANFTTVPNPNFVHVREVIE